MSEKSNGAKIAPFYDAQAAYRRELEAERFAFERDGMNMCTGGYVIALGPEFDDMPDMMAYACESGEATAEIHAAKMFESWAEAMRYALDKYEFPAFDYPIPKGYERPRFPRVLHVRLWAEITDC